MVGVCLRVFYAAPAGTTRPCATNRAAQRTPSTPDQTGALWDRWQLTWAHRYKDGLFFEEQRGHKTFGGKPLYCLETAARLWLYSFEVGRT